MTHAVRPPALESAELLWRDCVPESARFGDVYFSREDGLAESRYVFIKPNALPDRFARMPSGSNFVIAETGFGTGLNFLATWAEWRKHRKPGDNTLLHFISVERYPVTQQDLCKALALWPELASLAEELIAEYPPLIQGTHRILLDDGRVRLTLCFGDVLGALRNLTFTADAWFLDGFDPSLNPEMWSDEAIQYISMHSKPGTTLATFTSAGHIRRSLEASGFTLTKLPGFGHKREMLAGKRDSQPPPLDAEFDETVGIIGAGIAGTLLARNLAERGVPVLLIDQADGPGAAASGNPQGALYAKLGIEYNAQAELAATALSFSQRYYRPWQSDFWHPTGLLQLATTEQEVTRQQRFSERNRYPESFLIPIEANRASEIAGIAIESPGLWFPDSGWLQPARACERLSSHALIETVFNHRVAQIEPFEGYWRIRSEDGDCRTVNRLVIACGHQTGEVAPVSGELRLKPIRGQVSCLPESGLNLPDTVICGSKYLNPANHGQAVTGATFDLKSNNPLPTKESHQENVDELLQMLPSLSAGELPEPGSLTGRVAFRCTTHDYQPVAGELYTETGESVEGVFLFTGLGSKGLVWAPLLAEYLADRITGQPSCLPRYLAQRVETRRLYRKHIS